MHFELTLLVATLFVSYVTGDFQSPTEYFHLTLNSSHTNRFQATPSFLLLTNHNSTCTLTPISSSSQNDFISVTYFLIPSPPCPNSMMTAF